ncbi:hypothetical protein PN456_17250 [Nodularia spumigena CS-586/05]|uniref:hypothetical protein n=1 Tax=Nodularia spumigena TaxID=70799 RepID=UPI0023311844|nr:hypothetical protein [Nodularia spumigena]MDB9344579.1 hypothetical protein [Nodularia spumigena CS-588/06]MDB9370671.1 hypothetical protein [Nodularia spumigena CS-586/05]
MSTKSKNQKIGKRTLETTQISVVKRLTPFEDIIHLAGICEINLGGRKGIGALILNRNEEIQIKFCFDCMGIHPNLPSEQILPIFSGIESGLKEIPEDESLTIHFGSFTDDLDRQLELRQIESNCNIEQLKLLIRSERVRVKDLTKNGVRQNKFLRLWCTYTVATDNQKSQDYIESTINKLQKTWYKFTGEIHAINNNRIENVLRNSLTDGFQMWEQIISNKMKLSVKSLSAHEIWATLWKQFNRSGATPIPNPLTISEKDGVTETQNSDFHIRHHLLENEQSMPFLDRKWVKIQDKYIGALNFSEKPGGWVDEYGQLKYLWEVISRESISDTEVFCQINRVNQGIAKTNLQRLTKQSITSTVISSKGGSIDVKAGMNIEEAVEAQKIIYKGNLVVSTAVVFLVHRKTRRELDDACRYLASCFLRPAVVSREIEYAWKVWLQTCPFVWEALLTKPFNRRLPYFSSEAPGLMPLICTATGDKTGFELIAEEGGTPVHLDLYQNHKNLAVFGATRSGKSVLVAGILTPAIAQGIPVVALDYPKPDGTSTFTDYTNLLGNDGAYFDISKEFNNLFELPDLRGMGEEIVKERLSDFKEFIKSVLMTMIIGTNTIGVSASMLSNIESIVTLALETFFNEDEIKLRYKAALASGVGTKEWDDTPTLRDFYNYCSPGYIKLDSIANNSKEVLEALEQIRLRLKFWLNTRVGQSISQPSSFRTDAKLLVFALRNLASEADAAILALSAYAAALRRALSSKASIFFLDEAPILFQFESIAELIGRLCANGAKAGIRVIVSAQEPESIYQSKAAPKIFANLTTRLVGRIQSSAIDPFVERFKYPYEIIQVNSTEAFYPKKEGIYSQWLLDDNGKLTFCRYYPAYCLLASVANNPNEQELRTLFLNHYANNRLLGLFKFSEDYIRMIRGEELSTEAQQLLNQNKQSINTKVA